MLGFHDEVIHSEGLEVDVELLGDRQLTGCVRWYTGGGGGGG